MDEARDDTRWTMEQLLAPRSKQVYLNHLTTSDTNPTHDLQHNVMICRHQRIAQLASP